MLAAFANEARYGITNLPKDKKRLSLIHERAFRTFEEAETHPYFLFVLETFPEEKPIGVAGIYPRTGVSSPLRYLKEKRVPAEPIFPEMKDHYRLLEPISYAVGPSEICSLFLTHDARKGGLGRLLSFGRFLFIKLFPERFASHIFAEMRGYIDEEGNSPFWDALGRRFCPVPYKEFLTRRDKGDEVSMLIPNVPIIIDLMDKNAVNVIAATHPNTIPAKKILEEQGFKYTGEVDLFDAGPRLMAEREEILAIRKAKRFKIESIEPLQNQESLLSNCRLDFRACLGSVVRKGNGVVITPESAQLLEVDLHDEILAIF